MALYLLNNDKVTHTKKSMHSYCKCNNEKTEDFKERLEVYKIVIYALDEADFLMNYVPCRG